MQDPSQAGTFGTRPTVTVQHVGVAYSSKRQLDASWDRGQPFAFTLGGRVIPGGTKGS